MSAKAEAPTATLRFTVPVEVKVKDDGSGPLNACLAAQVTEHNTADTPANAHDFLVRVQGTAR